MAEDLFNNTDGAPKPDGEDDAKASTFAIQQYKAYLRKTAPADQKLPSGVVPLNDVLNGDALVGDVGGVTLRQGPDGTLIAIGPDGKEIVTGEKDNSFPVRVGTDPNAGGYTAGATAPAPVPYKTLLKDGFLGVSDQGVIDRVRLASNGDVKLFDKVYMAAVDRAALLQKTGKDVTVYDVLDQWRKGGLPSSIDSGNGGGGGPYSSTNRVVSLSDEGTARRLLNGALTSYLGRTATADENAMFLKALNVQERQNATVTKTVGNTSGRNTTQSQTVTGGMDKNDFAERFAKSQEGYAEYQAATTYLDAFIGSLEDDARVVG